MPIGRKLKFVKPKTRIPVKKGRKQGLTADGKVKISGNKKKIKRNKNAAFGNEFDDGDDDDDLKDYGFLSAGNKSTFPTGDEDDILAQLSRGEDSDMKTFASLANKHTRKPSKKKSKRGFGRGGGGGGDFGGGGGGGGSDMKFKRRGGMFKSRPRSPPPSRAPDFDELSFSGDDDVGSMGSILDDDDSYDSMSYGSMSYDDDYSSISGMSSTGRDVPLDDSMELTRGKKKGGMFGGITSSESEGAEKADLLARFHFLKNRGTHVSKNYTPKSNLNEMRMEMGRIEHEAQVAQTIKLNRRALMSVVSGIELVSDKYGPRFTKGKLHRVSHFVQNSIKDYDGAFERMSEDYGGVIGALTGGNPLYEIAATLLFQIVTYGLFYRGAEGAKANEEMTVDDIKARHPNLIRQAAEELLREKYKSPPPPPQQQQPQYAYPVDMQGVPLPPPPHYYPSPQHRPTVPMSEQYHAQIPPPTHAPHQANVTGQGYASMAPPSVDFNSYITEQQEKRHSMINTEDQNIFNAAREAQSSVGGDVRAADPIDLRSMQERTMISHPPDVMISDMHQPLPNARYEAPIDMDEYDDEDIHSTVATRRGNPPKIMTPKPAKYTLASNARDIPPIPEDDVGEYDDLEDEGDIVIDIN